MQAQILGVAQELSFEDGATINYIVLQLPNGKEVRALIESTDALAITEVFIKTGGAAAQNALNDAAQTDVMEPVVEPPRRQPMPARQPHPALARASGDDEGQALERNYTPLSLDGDGNAEFGGNFKPGMDDNLPTEDEYLHAQSELAEVDRQLQEAAKLVANAAGVSVDDMDPAALRRAVAALQASAPAPLPVPSWGNSAPIPIRPAPNPNRQALTIQSDGKGNPIFSGANVADMRDLAGGNMDGEESDEVGSV